MGTSGFDLGFQANQQRQQQRNLINEQQRIQQQNTVGMRLLDSINQASNIKPQIKDPNTGELIDNPAYADAQKDRATLMSQYSALNAPEQHASFGQHLHGLIFGKPETNPQQPALSPNSSPNTPPSPAPDANAAPVSRSSSRPTSSNGPCSPPITPRTRSRRESRLLGII